MSKSQARRRRAAQVRQSYGGQLSSQVAFIQNMLLEVQWAFQYYVTSAADGNVHAAESQSQLPLLVQEAVRATLCSFTDHAKQIDRRLSAIEATLPRLSEQEGLKEVSTCATRASAVVAPGIIAKGCGDTFPELACSKQCLSCLDMLANTCFCSALHECFSCTRWAAEDKSTPRYTAVEQIAELLDIGGATLVEFSDGGRTATVTAGVQKVSFHLGREDQQKVLSKVRHSKARMVTLFTKTQVSDQTQTKVGAETDWEAIEEQLSASMQSLQKHFPSLYERLLESERHCSGNSTLQKLPSGRRVQAVQDLAAQCLSNLSKASPTEEARTALMRHRAKAQEILESGFNRMIENIEGVT